MSGGARERTNSPETTSGTWFSAGPTRAPGTVEWESCSNQLPRLTVGGSADGSQLVSSHRTRLI